MAWKVIAQGKKGAMREYISSVPSGTKVEMVIKNAGRINCALADSWGGERIYGSSLNGQLRDIDVKCKGTWYSGSTDVQIVGTAHRAGLSTMIGGNPNIGDIRPEGHQGRPGGSR